MPRFTGSVLILWTIFCLVISMLREKQIRNGESIDPNENIDALAWALTQEVMQDPRLDLRLYAPGISVSQGLGFRVAEDTDRDGVLNEEQTYSLGEESSRAISILEEGDVEQFFKVLLEKLFQKGVVDETERGRISISFDPATSHNIGIATSAHCTLLWVNLSVAIEGMDQEIASESQATMSLVCGPLTGGEEKMAYRVEYMTAGAVNKWNNGKPDDHYYPLTVTGIGTDGRVKNYNLLDAARMYDLLPFELAQSLSFVFNCLRRGDLSALGFSETTEMTVAEMYRFAQMAGLHQGQELPKGLWETKFDQKL